MPTRKRQNANEILLHLNKLKKQKIDKYITQRKKFKRRKKK